eukprot:scaffold3960_cov116-Isochrysis_galbana.AAC.10
MHLLFIIELSLPAPRVLPSGQQRNAFAAHDGLSPARSVVAQCRREAVAYGDRIAWARAPRIGGPPPPWATNSGTTGRPPRAHRRNGVPAGAIGAPQNVRRTRGAVSCHKYTLADRGSEWPMHQRRIGPGVGCSKRHAGAILWQAVPSAVLRPGTGSVRNDGAAPAVSQPGHTRLFLCATQDAR